MELTEDLLRRLALYDERALRAVLEAAPVTCTTLAPAIGCDVTEDGARTTTSVAGAPDCAGGW